MAMVELSKTLNTIAGECIAVRLRMLNRAVTNMYDDALRPWNLKVSQLNILIATGKLGLAKPAEVCARLHLDVSTLSRNVERMKARGWLEVVASEDGRAQPFQLTSEGKNLVKEAMPSWKKAQKEAKAILGDAITSQLDEAVGRLNVAGR